MGFLDDMLDPEMAYRHVEQNSDEWDRVRAGRFTSSQMYRLLGDGYRPMTAEELKGRPKSGTGSKTTRIADNNILSDGAITYVYEKVAETLTGLVKETAYAYPIVYGKQMEPEAIEYFIEKTGLNYEAVGFIGFGDHAGGSPDGLIGESEVLEIKCPAAIDTQIGYLMLTDQYDVKRMYPAYYWQCMCNMLFTQRNRCHFVTYDPRYDEKQKMVHITIDANHDEFQVISDKIAAAVKEKLKLINLLT